MKTTLLNVVKGAQPRATRQVGTMLCNVLLFALLLLAIGTGSNVYAQAPVTYTANGNFIVPAGVTTVQVEAWGGGGAGGGGNGSFLGGTRSGGGGSGGAHTKVASVSVTPGATIAVTVGGGGTGVNAGNGNSGGTSTFASAVPVNAVGGGGGRVGDSNDSTGAGGTVATGTFNGGAGATATGTTSGGGGGGAGNAGVGGSTTNGTGGTGGAGTIPGGAGAAGRTSNGDGIAATALAGGGGGARTSGNNDEQGGAGFRGQVVVTYTCPTYALTSATTATGPFCGTSTAVVTMNSTSLTTATYTVTYNLSGATSATGLTASVAFNGTTDVGTFTTPVLAAGTTNVTIVSIANATCSSTLAANNTTSVFVAMPTTANAGTNVSMCSTNTSVNITAGATASNTTGITWTSTGTGTFTDANSLTLATYEPSADDILAGSVTITLTAGANAPCSDIISNKTLTILAPPNASAGGSATICSNQTHVVSGASSSNGTILWTEDGAGTITAGGTTLTPTYTAAAGDAGNTVTLTMTVSNSGCGSVQATYTISVVGAPTAVAGPAMTMCYTEGSINITSGSSSSNNNGVLWTSNGSGSISDATSMTNAVYTPGLNESGTITLTLTATGNGPCGNAIANKTLAISAQPTAAAGGSQTVCRNQTATVSGASSSNGTILWTHDGTGSLSGATTLAPTYTPAIGDEGDVVTLTMTVSNAPCTAATATYAVTVVGVAAANAGTTLSMCTNSVDVDFTAGASSTNNAGVLWTSNGTGTINNATSLTGATYTPGSGEVGNVTFTLTATGNSPCGNVSANKTVSILAIPVTTNVEICAGETGFLQSSTSCPLGASVSSPATMPGTAVNNNSAGSNAWANPGNITTAGSPYATVSTNFSISNFLGATNYGFAIPAGSVIGGVQVAINRQGSNASFGITDDVVRLVKNGALVGTDKSSSSTWGTSMTVANYGGATDLWGTTWNAAEINNANFGVVLSVGSLGNRTATVDYIRITITYQAPGEMRWYTVSSGGSPIGTGSSFNPVGVAGSPLADTNTAGVTTFYAECATVAGCRTPTTFTINALPEVSFTGLDASYCGTTASIALTGNQNGGIFQGAGITDNGDGTATFNPATAGAGVHNINYSYADGNGCPNDDIQSVTVIAPDTYYADVDGDGFGNLNSTTLSCTGAPAGYVADSTDCNDNQLQYLDADGDGFGSTTQVACGVINNTDCDDAVLNYLDADGDGFGSTTFVDCGGVLNNTDCNDAVLNYLDADGDGFGSTTFVNCGGVLNNTDCDDAVLNYLDADGDGFGSTTFVDCGGVLNNTDCNDGLLLYSDEDGDGFGSDTFVDCGGVANTLDCNDNEIQYLDGDSDGFGSMVQVACGVANNTDCDDADADKNAMFDFYVDADGDDFGTGSLVSVCAENATTPPANYSMNNTDCNDGDAAIWQTGVLWVDADNDGYNNGSTEEVCYGASVPSGYALNNIGLDCNDAVFAINPGHVEVLYNGIDDNCDGELDEGFQYTTEMFASQCASTLSTINSFIVFTSKPAVTMHRFEVTNVGTGQIMVIERYQNFFSPTMLPTYNYAETYSVRCEIQRNGIWLGYYGPSCLISTPAVLVPGGPGTISPSQCGNTLPTISTLIATTSLPNVTGYRFRITNASDPLAPNQIQTIDRGHLNWFALTMLSSFNYGTTYLVEVSLKTNGVFSPYGSPCAVTAPAVPMLVDCGNQIATPGALVSCASKDRATAYRFEITDFDTGVVTTLDRSKNWFTFNHVPGYTHGGLYGVRVAIMTSGHYSLFSEGCEIIAPSPARVASKEVAFNAIAYPNPFAENFSIRVETASEDNFGIKVYDMTGRLIENRTATLLDMQTLTVGDQYPAGVYNVIISQGTEVETLRVIKR